VKAMERGLGKEFVRVQGLFSGVIEMGGGKVRTMSLIGREENRGQKNKLWVNGGTMGLNISSCVKR